MLRWAARLHELGLAIAHSQYHVHGAYVVENSDIAGFSRQEQQFLAALVRTHRRGIPKSAFDALPDRLLASARRMRRAAAPGRAAAPRPRSRPDPATRRVRRRDALTIALSQRWLDARPLLRADLEGEPADMTGLGITLVLVAN